MKYLFALILIISSLTCHGLDVSEEMVLSNNGKPAVYMVYADQSIMDYLESIDPGSLSVKSLGLVLNDRDFRLLIDGKTADVNRVTYVSEVPEAESVEPDEPESPEHQIAEIERVSFFSYMRAVLWLGNVPYGENLITFTTSGSSSDVTFQWLFDTGRTKVDIGVVSAGQTVVVQIRVPDSGVLSDVASDILESFESFMRSMPTSIPYPDELRADYYGTVHELAAMGNDLELYQKVMKARRDQWFTVAQITHEVYLQMLLLPNTPGQMVMGWEDVKSGNLWGLVDLIPAIPLVTRAGKATKRISDIVIQTRTKINGLEFGRDPLLRLAAKDIQMLREYKASLTQGGKISESTPNRFIEFFAKRYPNGNYPKWVLELCVSSTKCVSPTTPVVTRHGLRPASSLAIGEQVLSVNEATGMYEFDIITDVTLHTAPSLMRLMLSTGTTLDVTPDHPLALGSLEQGITWTQAQDVPEHVQLISVRPVTVVSSELVPDDNPRVVTITTLRNNNYVVTEDGVIVHNKCVGQILQGISGSTEVDGLRKLLTNANNEWNTYWPMIMKSYTKNGIKAAEKTNIYRTLRVLMYQVSPGHHEWFMRKYIRVILNDMPSQDVQRKFMEMMHGMRTPTEKIRFNNWPSNSKGLKPGRWKDPETLKIYDLAHSASEAKGTAKGPAAYQFHKACEKAVEAGFIKAPNGRDIAGFDPQKYKDVMLGQLDTFFQGKQYDDMLEELNKHVAFMENLWN